MSVKAFKGTPADIGADVFIEVVMPIIRKASHGMQPEQLVQLYSGFVGAAFGSMEADFGKELANAVVNHMATTYTAQTAIEDRPIQ